MHFLRHDKKAFVSSILKHKLSHTDKENPENIMIPSFIEELAERKQNQLIQKLLKKYKQKNYALYNREELESTKNWQDIHFLTLFMYYKKGWSISLDIDNLHFPHFLTTYNPEPLQMEINKVTSKIYDKIDSKATKEELSNNYTYTALDITYMLYYLSADESKFSKDHL